MLQWKIIVLGATSSSPPCHQKGMAARTLPNVRHDTVTENIQLMGVSITETDPPIWSDDLLNPNGILKCSDVTGFEMYEKEYAVGVVTK